MNESNVLTIDIPSPCIGVCTIDDETGFCLGCARNLQEVARWRSLTTEQKQATINAIVGRKEEMAALGVDYRWRD